jgi:superfamily II DNA or RNA helicase
MKSNIAECEKRTKFLLNFLPRLIDEGRHVLLLSCRREHIFQMEKMINAMEIPDCTVGLYLGGMKQEDLDISATKRVIIATFNMAEEAFDCKSLNTLIYMTPHNNIEQAVGRILREEKKKRKIVPLIIDLFDQFSSFVKWNKIREKYYKSKGYPMKIFDVTDNTNTPITETKFIKENIVCSTYLNFFIKF